MNIMGAFINVNSSHLIVSLLTHVTGGLALVVVILFQ
jgi:hypothetical protein